MPAPASGLADVGTGDGDPPVGGGVGQQAPQQLPVRGLDLGAAGERQPGLRHPRGEPVADPLELAEPEHARLAGPRPHPVGDLDPAEGGAEQARELALQAPDLAAQIPPRGQLVELAGGEICSRRKTLHGPTRV
ncbi:MAG: hypothetical protein U0R71_13595 [Solirubrobacterales bacterium]